MPITLAGIDLPEDLQWVNEFSGFGVGQVTKPLLTGSLWIQESVQQSGRPGRFESGARGAWTARSVVEQLEALAGTPLDDGEFLEFVWGDGRVFDAVFDHRSGAPFSAVPVRRLAASIETAQSKYTISLSLLLWEQ